MALLCKVVSSKRESKDAPCNLHPAFNNTSTPLEGKVAGYYELRSFSYKIREFMYDCDGQLIHFSEIEVNRVVLGKRLKRKRKK